MNTTETQMWQIGCKSTKPYKKKTEDKLKDNKHDEASSDNKAQILNLLHKSIFSRCDFHLDNPRWLVNESMVISDLVIMINNFYEED